MEAPLKKLSPDFVKPELATIEKERHNPLILPTALFLLYNSGLVFLFWKTLVSLFALSSRDELFSHIPLIPLASAYLILMQIKDKGWFSVEWRPLPAMPFLGAGAAIGLAAFAFASSLAGQDYLAAMMLSFLLLWLGGFMLFFGFSAFRALRFPLLFLLFMVPLPTFLEDAYTRFLRAGSAEAANFFFWLSGVPFLRDGFVFSLPGLNIDVAPQCSGIRSSLALIIMSTLAGHMLLKTGKTKAILVLCSIPISMFKNGVRIATLSLVAIYVNPAILAGPLHRMGGIPFFLVALVLVVGLVWVLRRTEKV